MKTSWYLVYTEKADPFHFVCVHYIYMYIIIRQVLLLILLSKSFRAPTTIMQSIMSTTKVLLNHKKASLLSVARASTGPTSCSFKLLSKKGAPNYSNAINCHYRDTLNSTCISMRILCE